MGVFTALAFTSCSKEKDCECTLTNTAGGASIVTEQTIEDGDCSDLNLEVAGVSSFKCTEK